MNGTLSDLGVVTYGVPQRSILGLLLFLICVGLNDIKSEVDSDCFLYADD